MAPISVVFVLAVLLIATQQATVLNIEDLTTTNWNFYNDGGFLGVITFNPNGKITGYTNTNEVTWALNAQRMLEIYDSNGNITARFVFAFRDFYGKWRLSGKFLQSGAPIANGWTHYLEQTI